MNKTSIHAGTSGYAYKEWKGSFYPGDLPAKRMLQFYGERFRTVEINNTFYRMPSATVLEAWAAEVPAEFKFVLKAPRRITHIKRMKDPEESVPHLLEVAATLGEHLGALLFQLPPNMKKDVARLRAFLAVLGPARAAFEFRNESWFGEEVFALLRERNLALCIAEAESELEVPFVSTADWGYIRLRRPEYDDAQLKAWARRIAEARWREAYVFFKHEEAGKGPQLAQRFLELAAS